MSFEHSPSTSKPQIDSVTITRRRLLISTAHAVAGLALHSALGNQELAETHSQDASDFTQQLDTGIPLRDQPPSLSDSHLEPNDMEELSELRASIKEVALGYANTTAETTGFLLANVYVVRKLNEWGMPIGSSLFDASQQITSRISTSAIKKVIPSSVFGAPIAEELLFRWVPQRLFAKGEKGPKWKLGIISSLFFALIHNFYISEEGKTRFALNRVPLPQFTSGMYFWSIMRRKGLDHSVLAHSYTNALVLSKLYLLAKEIESEHV